MTKDNNFSNGIAFQLLQYVKEVGQLLDRGLVSGEQREIALLKVAAFNEIFNFLNIYPLWAKSTKNAEARFHSWHSANNSGNTKTERTARRQAKEQVEKEMLEKVGVNTVKSIYVSTSTNEIKNIIELFRERTKFRMIKRSYLVDLLIFSGLNVQSNKQSNQVYLTHVYYLLNDRVVTVNPEQFFSLFHLEGKRTSPKYGQEKRYLYYVLATIVDMEDEYFYKARMGISLYLQRKSSFANMIAAVRENVQELEGVQL